MPSKPKDKPPKPPIKKVRKERWKPKPHGRPTPYDDLLHPQLIQNLMMLEYTVVEIAQKLKVNVDTLYEWRKVHSRFSDAWLNGKTMIKDEAYKAAYNRLKGYKATEVTINEDKDGNKSTKRVVRDIPPDSTLIISILNRWDKQQLSTDTSEMDKVDSLLKALQAYKLSVDTDTPIDQTNKN